MTAGTPENGVIEGGGGEGGREGGGELVHRYTQVARLDDFTLIKVGEAFEL